MPPLLKGTSSSGPLLPMNEALERQKSGLSEASEALSFSPDGHCVIEAQHTSPFVFDSRHLLGGDKFDFG